MNTYFVFWKKVDDETIELEGRSVKGNDVSISDGKLKFWREVGNMASDNLVFSLPVDVLVDFHKVESMPATDNAANKKGDTKPFSMEERVEKIMQEYGEWTDSQNRNTSPRFPRIDDTKLGKIKINNVNCNANNSLDKSLPIGCFFTFDDILNGRHMEEKKKVGGELRE